MAAGSVPTVEKILRLEDPPIKSMGSRRAVVRWSDGTEGQVRSWYGDEVLLCEGDLMGNRDAEFRSLRFGRDRDLLRS